MSGFKKNGLEKSWRTLCIPRHWWYSILSPQDSRPWAWTQSPVALKTLQWHVMAIDWCFVHVGPSFFATESLVLTYVKTLSLGCNFENRNMLINNNNSWFTKKSEHFMTLCILGPDAMHAGWSAMMRELNRKSKKQAFWDGETLYWSTIKKASYDDKKHSGSKMEAKDRCLCFPGSSSSGTPRISPPVLLKSGVLLHILIIEIYRNCHSTFRDVLCSALNVKPRVTFRWFQSFKGQIQRNGNHTLTNKWTVAHIGWLSITSWRKHSKLSTERGNINSRNSQCTAA